MKKLRVVSLTLILALLCNPTVVAFHAPPWDTGHNSFSGDPGDTNTDPGTCEGECNSCPCTAKAMSPVEAASGNFVYTLRVLSISGLGPSLDVSLTYNSQDRHRGPFGVGWVNPYEQRIIETTDGLNNFAVYSLAEGKRERFRRNQDGTYTAPPRLFSKLTKNSDGTHTLRDKYGMVRRFNGQGQLTAIVDRNGNTLSLAYDTVGFMTTITDASGRAVKLTKGADGRVESMSDPANRTFRFVYDTSGNLTRYTDPLGNNTSYQYDSANNMTAMVDPRGNTLMRLTYDTTGRVSQHVDGAETWRYTYSPSTKRTTKRDSLNNTWTFDYNDNGNVTKITDPLGKTEVYVVDANLNVTQYTNKNAKTDGYTYDNIGNQLTAKDALNNVKTISYESVFNRPTMVRDALGNVTRLEYDPRGNLVKVINALGSVTQFQYDTKGQRTRVIDALGNSTELSYDAKGNQIQTKDPLGNTNSSTFDILGRILTSTDAEGRITQFAYDAGGRKIRTTNPLSGVTTYEYDASGNLTALTLANNAKTVFQYDALNRLIKISNPSNQSTSFTYDRKGNVASKVDAKNQTISYSYDALDRLIRKTKPDDIVSYVYDGEGNLLSVNDGDSGLNFLYDAVNHFTEARTTATTGQPSTSLRFSYDANGYRKTMTDPAGGVTKYEYDKLQRLILITNPPGQQFTFSYDGLSRRTSVARPASLSTTYQYDAASRVTSLSHQGGISPWSVNYTYDRTGNRLTITDIGGGLSSYNYDSLYRLTSASPATGSQETYSYDSVGNRTASYISASYSHNLANQLISDSAFDYTYDANGNLTRKSERATGKITNYGYDAENQLTRIDLPDGTTKTYRYDGLGRRIEKNVNGQSTRYIYDGQDILFEYAGASQTARYTFGPITDEVLSVTRGGVTSYFQADAQGSIIKVVSSGVVTATFKYDSYGRVSNQTGGSVEPYRFQGREFDQESKLYYFRARFYEPQLGRFISEDPIGFSGGENFYVFALDNPVNLSDPEGLAPSFGSCLGKCASDHYGLSALTAGSAVAATPIPKSWLGFPRGFGAASKTTNLLSVLGHYVEIGAPRLLNSANLFRIAGRANPYALAALTAIDAGVIGKCVYDCMNTEECPRSSGD